jgi:hypothetical protein
VKYFTNFLAQSLPAVLFCARARKMNSFLRQIPRHGGGLEKNFCKKQLTVASQ